jgi:1-acyl-sn-glycerol-3-phosphate acyltransferase
MAGLVIGALFILPFLLFSATSGQLTDKFDKTRVIRFVKNLEIAIMVLAAYGFLTTNVPVLLFCTFLMGLHSTLFGPVKFALLPQVLTERELTGGNGMVEMGTFVAILLGNIAGGLLVAIPQIGHTTVAVACIVAAIAGRFTAQFIPSAPATDTGSLLCEVLSRRHVEIGLVPLGAIGMSVFAVDLYFACRGLPASEVMGLAAFLATPAHWRVMADLALLSLFAGLYSVPMYALIQLRSQPTHRARIIAANNILNALFMIASSVIAGLLLTAGFTVPQIFLFVGLANAVVAFYIFLLVPEYLLRFVAWVVSRCVYRFKVTGDTHIPVTGPAILVCNHVSFVDAILLLAASPRPIFFVMDHRIFKVPVLGALFRLAKAIPIAPRAEDAAAYESAITAASKVLQEGDLLAIFPEGGITRDGTLQEFKGGIMKILERQPVPVIPMALTNLWGSFFSRVEQGTAMVRPFRRGWFSRVGLNVGPPVAPAAVRPDVLQAQVANLLAQTH